MSLYKETLYNIKHNKDVRDTGQLLAIPFWRMPKLSTVLPGITRDMYVIITSGTKESKSQICDYMFVFQPIEFIKANPECGLDIKIKYFSLEMSKEDKLAQAMCYRLFTDYNLLINPSNLMSIYQGYTLDTKILAILESKEFEEFFEFFEDRVEIFDNIKSPTSIMVKCENYARNNGRVIYEQTTWDDGTTHNTIKDYIPNKPEEIVEVIVDHATLMAEKGKTLYECIKLMSSDYFLKLKNKYKYANVLIQQQSASSTEQQFTNRGDNILEKVKPSREGLTGNRDTAMDCTLMLGTFSPYKYKESTYEGWDLTRIKDYHRELSIMLNRRGKSNITQQLFFNGASSFFKELPPSPTPDVKNSIYNYVDTWRNEESKYTQ